MYFYLELSVTIHDTVITNFVHPKSTVYYHRLYPNGDKCRHQLVGGFSLVFTGPKFDFE
jgi:hypothetical protein